MKVINFVFSIIFVLFITSKLCNPSKILFLLPLSFKSHIIVVEPLIKALSDRGHDILVLAPVPLSTDMPKSVQQKQLLALDDIYFNMTTNIELRTKPLGNVVNYEVIDRVTQGCARVLTHPYLHTELISKLEKFDLVIVDILLNHCALGLIPYFEAASIYIVTTAALPSYIANTVGNRLSPSFVPNMLLPFSEKMSFTERIVNTLVELNSAFGCERFFAREGERMYRNYLPNGSNLPSINVIRQNVSLIFVNSHIALNSPVPLLSNVIQIGAMHTRPVTKLPQDLDDFMSGAGQDGVILFSMGLISTMMPEETRQVFVNVFSQLKQRVVWKWNSEVMYDASPNVLLREWLPQQDILGHPNIKLFLNHGGLLSLQEAAYHGVPVIGFPVTGDTGLNIKQAEYLGYGKIAEIINLDEITLAEAIMDVLNNERYKEKAKELSVLMRDVPQSSLDKAVFWTEYVLRHKGAPHLSSAAKDLNFFQYYLLDVTAVLFGGVVCIIYLVLKCCSTKRKLRWKCVKGMCKPARYKLLYKHFKLKCVNLLNFISVKKNAERVIGFLIFWMILIVVLLKNIY